MHVSLAFISPRGFTRICDLVGLTGLVAALEILCGSSGLTSCNVVSAVALRREVLSATDGQPRRPRRRPYDALQQVIHLLNRLSRASDLYFIP